MGSWAAQSRLRKWVHLPNPTSNPMVLIFYRSHDWMNIQIKWLDGYTDGASNTEHTLWSWFSTSSCTRSISCRPSRVVRFSIHTSSGTSFSCSEVSVKSFASFRSAICRNRFYSTLLWFITKYGVVCGAVKTIMPGFACQTHKKVCQVYK